MLTETEVCTLCNRAVAHLDGLKQRLLQLQKEEQAVRDQIVATQALVASFSKVLGQDYDPVTVPFDL